VKFSQHPALPPRLQRIDDGLSVAEIRFGALPGGRGGRTPLGPRHALLVSLADIYSRVNGRPTTSPKSRFIDFATLVLQGIGWGHVAQGVEHAVPDAIKHWKNVTENRAGSSNI
jgi:hypothetical protein